MEDPRRLKDIPFSDIFPSSASYGSMDKTVAGSYLNEEPRTAMKAGCVGSNEPEHILDSIGHNTTTDRLGSDDAFPVVSADMRRKRQKNRAFWAIKSATSFYSDKMAWWLTLTNTPDSRPVYESWNVLRTYIKRTTRRDMVKWVMDKRRDDYSLKEERLLLNYYSERMNELDEPLDFHFVAIRTSEGYGVYHMFLYGDMLPVSWLRYNWKKITNGANQIRVEKIKTMSAVQRYALQQYAVGQDEFVRVSMSRDLIYPGARNIWKDLVKTIGYDRALPYWKYCMMVRGLPDVSLPGTDFINLNQLKAVKDRYRLVSERESKLYWLTEGNND